MSTKEKSRKRVDLDSTSCHLDVTKFTKYFTSIKKEGGYPGEAYIKLQQLWELVRTKKFVEVFVTTVGETTAHIVYELNRIIAVCVPLSCLCRTR